MGIANRPLSSRVTWVVVDSKQTQGEDLMRSIRLLGVALVASVMLSALVAAAASAVEPTKILPEPTAAKPLTGTSKSGKGTLLTVGGSEVSCGGSTATFEFTTPNLGKTAVTFTECRTVILGSTLTCTGVGDAAGVILFTGAVHYVLALRMKSATETELVTALVVLVTQFHFTCSAGLIKALVLMRGCVAALAKPLKLLTKVTEAVFKEFKSGESEILEFLPEETTGAETLCLEEMNVNETKFELVALTGTLVHEGFKQGGVAVEVLLMP
jgi:hypothetical protein